MASKRAIKTSLVLCLVTLGVGLALGLLINDLPYVSFKREVDLGTVISVLGLIATIFIMPFIVQRYLSREDNINTVILIDIDEIYANVKLLQAQFLEIKSSTKITKKTYMKILAAFKTISAEILSVSAELESRKKMPDFKKNVYDVAFTHAYETCTEPLKLNGSLNDTTILDANKALNALCGELRKYRYETYA